MRFGFKHPHVRQEKSSYFDAIEQGVNIRAKRRPMNLPDDRDDRYRSDVLARCWKHYRATQYK